MEKKIIVIAGNRKQFEEYLSAIPYKESRGKYVYASDAHSIQGIQAESVVKIGTYYERKDKRELEELAMSRIF